MVDRSEEDSLDYMLKNGDIDFDNYIKLRNKPWPSSHVLITIVISIFAILAIVFLR